MLRILAEVDCANFDGIGLRRIYFFPETIKSDLREYNAGSNMGRILKQTGGHHGESASSTTVVLRNVRRRD